MSTIHWVDGFVGGIPAPGEKRGATVEKTVSHHANTKAALKREATKAGAKAHGYLAIEQAKHPGSSTWIKVQRHAKLDWSVHLYSIRGVVAATSIEYGHTGTGAGGAIAPFQVEGKQYPGKFILHRAFGMKRR